MMEDEAKRKEREEVAEERRLTRAELLAAQAVRTQLTLESHERHFIEINGHIREFAKEMGELNKKQIERDTLSAHQLKTMTVLLSCMMFLAAAGSILATVLQ